jgi:hypothetical protein
MMPTIREVTYDGEDYELKFDGANQADRDLLCSARIPIKRPAPKLELKRVSRLLQRRPLTVKAKA